MKKLTVLVISLAVLCMIGRIANADLNAGLVAHYPFDGNANDVTVNENNGTVYEAVFVDGFTGQGLQFDGVNDYAVIPNSPSLNTSTFTVAFSWKFNYIDTDYNHDICYTMVVKRDTIVPPIFDGTYEVQYFPYNYQSEPQQHGPTLRVWMGDGSQETVAFNDNILLEEGHWYHVAATYGQSYLRLYLDGQEVAYVPATMTTNAGTGDVFIGRNNSYVDRFSDGIIDELRIYNRALSEAEVEELYNITPEPICGCEMTPTTIPTEIPRGENLVFQATITNNTDQTGTVGFATKVTLPNGSIYPTSGYLFRPIPVYLTPYQSRSGHLSQGIPVHAPLGTYTYHGYVGRPGVGIFDECQFDFEVTESGHGGCTACH